MSEIGAAMNALEAEKTLGSDGLNSAVYERYKSFFFFSTTTS